MKKIRNVFLLGLFCCLIGCTNDSGLLVFESEIEIEFLNSDNTPIEFSNYEDNIFIEPLPYDVYGFPRENIGIYNKILSQEGTSNNVLKLNFRFTNEPFRYYSGSKEPVGSVELRKIAQKGGAVDLTFTVQVQGYENKKETVKILYQEPKRVTWVLEKMAR